MIKTQRGWTIWSLMGVAVLIVIGALLFMKLMPVYLDNYKLQEAMHTVAADPRAHDWNKHTIIREMNKILYIDYGADIVDLNNALTVDKTDTQSFINIQYEVVVPLVYNVSALVKFKDQAEISAR
ncbi:MAG: DUF4845 domain-containing protein [Arenicellales bacterium]